MKGKLKTEERIKNDPRLTLVNTTLRSERVMVYYSNSATSTVNSRDIYTLDDRTQVYDEKTFYLRHKNYYISELFLEEMYES